MGFSYLSRVIFFLKIRFWISPEKFTSLYSPGGQMPRDIATKKETWTYRKIMWAGLVYKTKTLWKCCRQGAQLSSVKGENNDLDLCSSWLLMYDNELSVPFRTKQWFLIIRCVQGEHWNLGGFHYWDELWGSLETSNVRFLFCLNVLLNLPLLYLNEKILKFISTVMPD